MGAAVAAAGAAAASWAWAACSPSCSSTASSSSVEAIFCRSLPASWMATLSLTMVLQGTGTKADASSDGWRAELRCCSAGGGQHERRLLQQLLACCPQPLLPALCRTTGFPAPNPGLALLLQIPGLLSLSRSRASPPAAQRSPPTQRESSPDLSESLLAVLSKQHLERKLAGCNHACYLQQSLQLQGGAGKWGRGGAMSVGGAAGGWCLALQAPEKSARSSRLGHRAQAGTGEQCYCGSGCRRHTAATGATLPQGQLAWLMSRKEAPPMTARPSRPLPSVGASCSQRGGAGAMTACRVPPAELMSCTVLRQVASVVSGSPPQLAPQHAALDAPPRLEVLRQRVQALANAAQVHRWQH